MTTPWLNISGSHLRATQRLLTAIALLVVVSCTVYETALAADPEALDASVDPSDESEGPDFKSKWSKRLPVLQTPNDVRDILTVSNGFFVATGTAIIRYEYFGGKPISTSVYTPSHGLPSSNCYSLRRDALGGVWARCAGGLGYLAPNSNRWQSFTGRSGLATGAVQNVVFSADENRVWVCSRRGIATTLVDKIEWQVFPADDLFDIFVHPTLDIVWCSRNRLPAISQFTLVTREWRDIPEPQEYADRYRLPCALTVIHGKLWISRSFEPPWLYHLSNHKTQNWPTEPNWERHSGRTRTYTDWFGEVVTRTSRKSGPWFATNAGIWRFDSKQGQWRSHVRTTDPDLGYPLLVCGNDGKTLYWSSKGTVAAFNSETEQWFDLWRASDVSFREEKDSLTLSPDGNALWLIGMGGVIVGNPITRKVIALDDADHPGLTEARFVRFDPSQKLALIGTSLGVVCSDYEGNLKFALSRSAPPIDHRVTGFEFAPDGSEVWCLMEDESNPAILFPREDRWELAFDPRTSGHFFCMKVSSDGKTVWLSRRLEGDHDTTIVQRKPGESTWIPFSVQMPDDYGDTKKIVESPKRDEIWMVSATDGLTRANLTTGEITQYVKSDYLRHEGIKYETLVEDFVHDLTFTNDGKIAVCSAGSDGGITVINLETGVTTNHEIGLNSIDHLIASPDNRTVWCVVPHAAVWAFDTQTNSWTHRFARQDVPLESFENLNCSADGTYVWVHGIQGLAVYSVAEDSWKSFFGDDEYYDPDVFRITSDGKHVLCSHGHSLALINIDGSECVVLPPNPGLTKGDVTHLVPIPGTPDFVCFVADHRNGGLYYVDVNHRALRKLKDMKDSDVTAMAIGPDGFLWLANSGQILCLDPQTGLERMDLPALRIGAPETKSLRHSGKLNSSRIRLAPDTAARGRVNSAPELLPLRPPAVSLQNKGLVGLSTKIPTIATSSSGRAYVTWLLRANHDASAKGSMSNITDHLPTEVKGGNKTGISVYDGQQWLPPQFFECDVSFLWCQDEDLHLLIETSKKELYHLRYQPSAQAWTKVNVLNHGGTTFCVQGNSVHLAWFDHEHQRVCYRLYNGQEWLEPNWFDVHGNFDGLAVAAGNDGQGHVVWRDGGQFITHAWIKDGNAKHSRQEFSERMIAKRDFAVAVLPDGSLTLAYSADLDEGHPDNHHAQLRTWNGQTWSNATVLPFKHFRAPIFVRHADKTLLSWVTKHDKARVFSVIGSDGSWSYPLPLFSSENDELRRDYFVNLHADPQGRVHAVWCIRDETFTTIVTDLGK